MTDDPRPFRIAFVTGVTVSKWTTVWAERHPRIPLQVLPTDAASQTDVLRTGTADMAFVRLPVDAEFSVIPLYSETAYVVVARDHPVSLFDSVTLADLAAEQITTGAPEDAIALVAAGVGVAIMPQSLARLHSRKDVVARPISDGEQTAIGLAWIPDVGAPDVRDDAAERIEEFIGIVRGRTARSSRGSAPPAAEQSKKTEQKKRDQRPARPGARPARPGRAAPRRRSR